jgi:hypothetical protein
MQSREVILQAGSSNMYQSGVSTHGLHGKLFVDQSQYKYCSVQAYALYTANYSRLGYHNGHTLCDSGTSFSACSMVKSGHVFPHSALRTQASTSCH